MKTNRTQRTSRKKITYVETISDIPMTPEELERVLRLVGKIIGDVYIKEMRAKQSTLPPTSSDESS